FCAPSSTRPTSRNRTIPADGPPGPRPIVVALSPALPLAPPVALAIASPVQVLAEPTTGPVPVAPPPVVPPPLLCAPPLVVPPPGEVPIPVVPAGVAPLPVVLLVLVLAVRRLTPRALLLDDPSKVVVAVVPPMAGVDTPEAVGERVVGALVGRGC